MILLKLQGKSQKTIDAYSRAVRRVSDHFDCCTDQLTPKQLETYLGDLVDSHSWSTVKIDRNGLQFFWRHVLNRDWQWVNIIKPPKDHTIPDILTTIIVPNIKPHSIILKCYSNFSFHHGLFLVGFLFPNITLERDRDLINF